MTARPLEHVDYDALDRAKQAFIEAGRKTLKFAQSYGFIPDERLGSSANIFELDLQPFLKADAKKLSVTLLPEGLGTADDARPDDMTSAEAKEFWRNIATKTLSAITNDAATGGMQPVLLSLYLPSATPEMVFNQDFLDGFLGGIVDGCRTVGCVYFSGETPQLKSKFKPGVLDIAGATFGLVPAGQPPVDSSTIAAGNQIVLVESAGVHENGFTSFRDLAEHLPNSYRTKLPSGEEYWKVLNAPSKLYSPLVQAVLQAGIQPTNIEQISGHGWQKLMRSAKPLRYVIKEMLRVPEIFTFIQEQTGSSAEDMVNKFNYGAGLAVYVADEGQAQEVVKLASEQKLKAVVAGEVEAADKREVVIEPFNVVLKSDQFILEK